MKEFDLNKLIADMGVYDVSLDKIDILDIKMLNVTLKSMDLNISPDDSGDNDG